MSVSIVLSILLQVAGGLKPADEGAVAGMLRLHDGIPASGVRVAVMAPPSAGRGEPQGAGTLVMQGQSDDSGKYRLDGVPPGRYYVVAGKLDAPTFYPGVREFAKARVINVGPKTTVGDIDFEIDSAMIGTPPDLKDPGIIAVKGSIVLKGDLTSPPPPAITFEVPVPNGRTGTTLIVAANGTFTLPLKTGDHVVTLVGLPDGYTLVSMTSGGKEVRSQPLHVDASTELVVTLNADPRPRFRILGRVVDATDRPLAGEQVELVLTSGEIKKATVNTQGMVTFSSLFPGTYLLRLVSPRLEAPEKRITLTSSADVELRAHKR